MHQIKRRTVVLGLAGLSLPFIAASCAEDASNSQIGNGMTLAFPDLGGEGNLGGIIVGVQPRLTGSSSSIGSVLGRRNDPDVGLHLEAFYRLALNNKIDITPGIFWITAPNHDNDNADIIVGTLRTTFRF